MCASGSAYGESPGDGTPSIRYPNVTSIRGGGGFSLVGGDLVGGVSWVFAVSMHIDGADCVWRLRGGVVRGSGANAEIVRVQQRWGRMNSTPRIGARISKAANAKAGTKLQVVWGGQGPSPTGGAFALTW